MSDYDLDLEWDDTGTYIVRLTITGDNITAQTIQQIKFRQIRRGPPPEVDEELLDRNIQRIQDELPTKGRGKVTPESFLQLIADTYKLSDPNFPIKDMAERTGFSPNTVSSWVHRARTRGVLEPHWRPHWRHE